MSKNIYFTGFMGSGKTSASKRLCALSGANWIDTDDEIERVTGKTISQIFAEDGEENFRQTETEVLRNIASLDDITVVSCGGGLVLRDENVNIMQNSGSVIYLSANPETIYEHVRYSHNRPLLEGNMNPEYIGKLLDKRLPFYERAADYSIITDGKDIDQIASEIYSIFFA